MSYKLDSRWSQRGLKKCPKCSTPNGHRAAFCKNKQCQQSLGNPSTSKTAPGNSGRDHFLAVRIKSLHRDPSVQLYSVRRLNGTKVVRGFVEIRECLDHGGTDQMLQFKTGVCYVDCQPHTGPEGTCQHVRVASESTEVAEGLVIQREFLDQLNVTVDEREAIWRQQLGCGDDNPLVQKVAADTFVVKCEDEFHQPVPYCHVQLKQPSSIIYDCQILAAYENTTSCYHTYIVAAAILSSPKYRPVFENIVRHLLIPQSSRLAPEVDENIPFLDNMILLPESNSPLVSYPPLEATDQFLVATIEDPPAIATNSDVQLINCKLELESELAIDFNEPVSAAVSTSPIIELINSTENTISAEEVFGTTDYDDDNLQLMDCQIELMDQFNLTDRIDFCPSDIELSDDNIVFPADEELGLAVEAPEPIATPMKNSPSPLPMKKKSKLVEVTTKKAALKQTCKVAKEKMKKGSYNVRRLMRILESNGVVFNRIKRAEATALAAGEADADEDRVAPTDGSLPSFQAALCRLTFNNWLEFVIEQVNSVINYGDDGKPATQIFSVHEDFFQCLRSRFSVGHCWRLPDLSYTITEPVNRKGLTCHRYQFSCYKSLRHVFKTDKIALKFVKSFCRSSTITNSYDEIDLPDDALSEALSKGRRTIRAYQFKTYIKMGSYRSDPSKKVYHFVIEWISGVLPKSRFGEMRISFEYGHKENLSYVEPPPAVVLSASVSEGFSATSV